MQTLPAFRPSVMSSFLPKRRGGGGRDGLPGLSPRFATEECRSWVAHRILLIFSSLHKMICERHGHFRANPGKSHPLVYLEAGRKILSRDLYVVC